jgi:hypothetical protein
MIPHAAQLDAAYGSSAWTPITRVTLISPTLAGGETQVVAETVEGTLTLSDTNWPRTTLEMTVPAGVTSSDSDAPVTPFGGRVVVEMGAILGGAQYTFQVCDLDVTEVFLERPTNAWTIRAASQEARVNAATPYVPVNLYDYASYGLGTGTTSNAVRSLISECMPGYDPFFTLYPASISLASDDVLTVTDEITSRGDLWPIIEEAMDLTGGEAYFRYDRRLVLRTDPVIGSPVQTLKVGDGGTITDYRDVSRWAINAVHVEYEKKSDGSLKVGLWENTDPTSPTRIDGPYGRHVRVETRQVATLPLQARCDARAASIGKRASAPARRLEIDCVPLGWLEPGDTVATQLVEGSLTNVLVSGVRIPLSQLEPMTLTMHDSGL